MVSFQCDGCADTVKKPALDKHRQRCWASFTCLDCSTTFQNQDYKKHTSCISEAEKYQGALYKGAKKNQAPVPLPPAAASSSSSPAPGIAPAIHPSRLNQLSAPEPSAYTPRIQSYPVRGGGGRFGRGRGGFSRGGGATGSDGMRYSATGENTKAPEGGMRSWGSNANSEAGDEVSSMPKPTTIPTPIVSVKPRTQPTNHYNIDALVNGSTSGSVANGESSTKKNKNKKKGDKKGTGSRANTKNPKKTSQNGTSPPPVAAPDVSTSASVSAPSSGPVAASTSASLEKPSKKRKFEETPSEVVVNNEKSSATIPESALVSDKTLKRIRKNLTKLSEKKGEQEVSLQDWIAQAGKNKDKAIDGDEVMKSLKVSLVDGQWRLSV